MLRKGEEEGGQQRGAKRKKGRVKTGTTLTAAKRFMKDLAGRGPIFSGRRRIPELKAPDWARPSTDNYTIEGGKGNPPPLQRNGRPFGLLKMTLTLTAVIVLQ